MNILRFDKKTLIPVDKILKIEAKVQNSPKSIPIYFEALIIIHLASPNSSHVYSLGKFKTKEEAEQEALNCSGYLLDCFDYNMDKVIDI